MGTKGSESEWSQAVIGVLGGVREGERKGSSGSATAEM